MHKRRRHSTTEAQSHRWTHFLQHFRIFIYVMALLIAIDVIGGTEDFFAHWVAGIWGAILAMHFVETAFFGGGLFGHDEPVESDIVQTTGEGGNV